MAYFDYHKIAKKLIANGKLTDFYFVEEYNGIKPALVLLFNDARHPIMPIREHRFDEYIQLLKDFKKK